MSKLLPYEAKEPIFSLSEGISPRIAKLEVVIIEFTEEMISIGNCRLFGLINCIDYLEDLLPKKLIITTHNHSNILGVTVVENRIVDVGDCASALFVADESKSSS
jgi:hypothetical protein